jgi:hypothetical protein
MQHFHYTNIINAADSIYIYILTKYDVLIYGIRQSHSVEYDTQILMTRPRWTAMYSAAGITGKE